MYAHTLSTINIDRMIKRLKDSTTEEEIPPSTKADILVLAEHYGLDVEAIETEYWLIEVDLAAPNHVQINGAKLKMLRLIRDHYINQA